MSNARTLANTINSSSEIVVPSGGVNFGTGTDGSGTVTGGILDDYEEGTWTPNIFGSDPTGTFSGSSTGIYTKIGNLVIASGYAVVTGMTGAGYLRVSLPFTCATNTFGSVMSYNLNWPHSGSLALYAVALQAYCELFVTQDDGYWNNVDVENASWEVGYTATYQVQ